MKRKFYSVSMVFWSIHCVSHLFMNHSLFIIFPSSSSSSSFYLYWRTINFPDRLDERCEIWKEKKRCWTCSIIFTFAVAEMKFHSYVTLNAVRQHIWLYVLKSDGFVWHESYFIICDLWSDLKIWTLCQLSGLNVLNAGVNHFILLAIFHTDLHYSLTSFKLFGISTHK